MGATEAIETTIAGVSARLASLLSAFHAGHALVSQPGGQGNEPQWLHTLGQISGTLLMLELCFVLLLVCVLAFGIAYAMYWTHTNVTPLLERYSDKARRTMAVVERGSDRVVEGIAEFHGRRQGIEAALRVFFFGPKAAAGLLDGRKPLALPERQAATAPRPADTTTFALNQPPAPEYETAAPDTQTAPTDAAPLQLPPSRQTPPTWRSLPTANASGVSEISGMSAPTAVIRQWRQVGRAGTASGARAGNHRGVPAIG